MGEADKVADNFGGMLANGPLSGIIASAIAGTARTYSLPLPSGFPLVTVRPLNLSQSNAITRTVTTPLVFADLFKDNDVIVNAF